MTLRILGNEEINMSAQDTVIDARMTQHCQFPNKLSKRMILNLSFFSVKVDYMRNEQVCMCVRQWGKGAKASVKLLKCV